MDTQARKPPPSPDPDAERAWLAHVLTRDIPLGGAMALEIAALDASGITLTAPLAPNVNDKGTAFGGALATLMILAGWSLPRLLLRRRGMAADLVIGRCEMHFVEPVTGALRAFCPWPEPAGVRTFLERLERRGRGRLDLGSL